MPALVQQIPFVTQNWGKSGPASGCRCCPAPLSVAPQLAPAVESELPFLVTDCCCCCFAVLNLAARAAPFLHWPGPRGPVPLLGTTAGG